jgi:hypothetical protein
MIQRRKMCSGFLCGLFLYLFLALSILNATALELDVQFSDTFDENLSRPKETRDAIEKALSEWSQLIANMSAPNNLEIKVQIISYYSGLDGTLAKGRPTQTEDSVQNGVPYTAEYPKPLALYLDKMRSSGDEEADILLQIN